MNKKVSILLLSSILGSSVLNAGRFTDLFKQEQLGRWASAQAYAGKHPVATAITGTAVVAGLGYGIYAAWNHIKSAGSIVTSGAKKAWENKGKVVLAGAGIGASIAAWYYRSNLKNVVEAYTPEWLKRQENPVLLAAEAEVAKQCIIRTPSVTERICGMFNNQGAQKKHRKQLILNKEHQKMELPHQHPLHNQHLQNAKFQLRIKQELKSLLAGLRKTCER